MINGNEVNNYLNIRYLKLVYFKIILFIIFFKFFLIYMSCYEILKQNYY